MRRPSFLLAAALACGVAFPATARRATAGGRDSRAEASREPEAVRPQEARQPTHDDDSEESELAAPRTRMPPGAEADKVGCVPDDVPADNPLEAMRWRRLSWLDEHGRIEPGAVARALEQRRASFALARPKAAGLSRLGWTNRGPQNVGGRTRSLVISPLDPSVMWAGSVGGGIWKTADGGTTWRACDDFMATLAANCLAIDSRNPDILYCGTGEGYFNGDALGGVGIFKTTDGGATWTVLPATSGFGNVNRIAIDPDDSAILLATTLYGGIWRSTDAGGTWTKAQDAQGAYCVAFHPGDGRKAIATIIDYDWTVNDWVHRVAWSGDSGATWQTSTGLDRVAGFGSRMEAAWAASTPRTVYVHAAAGGGVIWKSTDSGQSFREVTITGTTGASWYTNAFWVSPVDSSVMVAGGYQLWLSTDGGVTLTQLTDGYMFGEQPHADQHFVSADPRFDGTSNRTIYATGDGGVFKASDLAAASPTQGWASLNVTYQTLQYYGAQGRGASGTVVGGTQDNGTIRSSASSTDGVLTYGGDGGWCAIDPTTDSFLYGEYVGLTLHRSQDGGGSSANIYDGLADAGTDANFIAPFILDPTDPDVILAGGGSLWRGTNVRWGSPPTWTPIRPRGSDRISAIAAWAGGSDVTWVAQNDGVVAMSADATASAPAWVTIDDNGGLDPLPNRYPTRILIDRDAPGTVYVSFGGWTDGNLQRTDDGGLSWRDVTGDGATGLPLAPIRGIARHPQHPDWLYVGTEVGVYESEDGGLTWSTTNDGPANVSVDELSFLSGSTTLLAATHGRGLWTSFTCPSAPSRVDGTTTGDRVDLTWTPVVGVSEYHVLRGPWPSGPYTVVGIVDASTTSFTDRVPIGGLYSYVVRAFAGCESPDSRGVTAITCTDPRVGALQASDADACATGAMALSWDAPDWGDTADDTRRLRVARDGSFVASGGCAGLLYDALACTDDTATPGTHAYRLSVTNGCDRTSLSATSSASDRVDVPGSATDLRVAHDRSWALTLSWRAAANATGGHAALQDVLPNGPFATASPLAAGVTTLGLARDAAPREYFLVVGVNGCGQGPRTP